VLAGRLAWYVRDGQIGVWVGADPSCYSMEAYWIDCTIEVSELSLGINVTNVTTTLTTVACLIHVSSLPKPSYKVRCAYIWDYDLLRAYRSTLSRSIFCSLCLYYPI